MTKFAATKFGVTKLFGKKLAQRRSDGGRRADREASGKQSGSKAKTYMTASL